MFVGGREVLRTLRESYQPRSSSGQVPTEKTAEVGDEETHGSDLETTDDDLFTIPYDRLELDHQCVGVIDGGRCHQVGSIEGRALVSVRRCKK